MGDIQKKMIDGIDNSAVSIVFITMRYMDKVAGKGEKRGPRQLLVRVFAHCNNKIPREDHSCCYGETVSRSK